MVVRRTLASMWRLSRVRALVSKISRGSFALALILVAPGADAAPIEASASAEQAQAERARDQAIVAARRAALEQAISGIDVPVDPAAVQTVLDRSEAWTAAYRVLDVAEHDGRIEVRIEVEIDLPRLRKRVAAGSTGTGAAASAKGFRFAKLSASGCPAIDEAALKASLRAYGIVADTGDSSLSLAITCSDRGAVAHTHVRAAAVEIVATIDGAVRREERFSSQGFAEQLDAAADIALERGLAELGDQLAVDARGDLELHVEHPWPAARIGVLERSLRESVIGVDLVELAGIAADGSVVLHLAGRIDAKQLGRALQDLTFPGFGLVGLRVDGHALRVRMQ